LILFYRGGTEDEKGGAPSPKRASGAQYQPADVSALPKAAAPPSQEQEAEERGMWKRGGTPRPASVWRWMEYGVFDGVGSTLYMKLYLRKLIDEGTGSTFNALDYR